MIITAPLVYREAESSRRRIDVDVLNSHEITIADNPTPFGSDFSKTYKGREA